MRVLFVATIGSLLLMSGCLEVSPPDRDPDWEFRGETPLPFDEWYPGHTFTLVEGTRFVTACFDFDHEVAAFTLGGHGVGDSYLGYWNKTEPFCERTSRFVDNPEWHVRINTSEAGSYHIRLWTK